MKEKNLASEHLKGLLAMEADGRVRIEYGFNSGGYESNVYFVTKDGGCLHIDTVIAEIDEVDFTDPDDSQWFIIGSDVNYEDGELYDAHTNALIPAAYGD
ncbi:hypothetical protein MUG78_17440 [Gordonia alkaliphila]|uniref:hypothetical protein n=1 Tax=Gordonia alkaliphila TaxID=1053547 RepID=UPI001FF1C392|nr:hypothetical protein [Gordonia alkaliphila]MCK0441185.1 hypothetical protein [Gordonia alkaliphila]